MVNQKVALSSGFQPCSTVKVSVALAGLSEKVIQPATKYRLGGMKMDLTYALAHSNNYYFATLGEKLGFERVSYYSRLFGYGEKAGLNIPGEQPGRYPDAAAEERRRRHADQLRRRDPADAAAIGGADERDRQRRDAELPAISAQPGRSAEFRAAREAAPGYRGRDSDGEARDARRGGVRHRPPRARRRRHRGQDGNLQRESHAPGLVRIFQRRRRPQAGGGGAVDRRPAGDRPRWRRASRAMSTGGWARRTTSATRRR